jgi:hypothetical protein
MSNEMVYGKILHETQDLALARIDLMGGNLSLYIILDKEAPAILGVGLSRRQVFANARDNAVDDEMLEKIEELELA